MLTDPDGVVKGTHFVVGYGCGVLKYLGAQAGELLDEQMSFFKVLPGEKEVDLSAAALGEGVTFGHSGPLAELTFRGVGEESISLTLLEVTARDATNNDVLISPTDVVIGPPIAIPTEVFMSSRRKPSLHACAASTNSAPWRCRRKTGSVPNPR